MTAEAASSDLDPSFGTNGKVITQIGRVSADRAFAAALQPDGKIVVAGDSFDGSDVSNLVVTRVNPDGSLDTSFGVAGKAIKRFKISNRANSVIIQNDGKIVAGGIGFVEVSPDIINYLFLLVRFNSDGSVDNSFGTDGVIQTSFVAGANNYLRSCLKTHRGCNRRSIKRIIAI